MNRPTHAIRRIGGSFSRVVSNTKTILLSRHFGAVIVALVFVLGFGWLTNVSMAKIAHAYTTEGLGVGVLAATGTAAMATALELPTLLRKVGLLIGVLAVLGFKFRRLLRRAARRLHEILARWFDNE